VYRAGNFIAERMLPPQVPGTPYYLAGVTAHPGGDGFSATQNLILKGYFPDHNAGPDDVYARIILPRPRAIVSLRPMKQPIQTVYDPLRLMDGRNTCGVHVLRYDAPDLAKVRLYIPGGAHGSPEPVGPEPEPFGMEGKDYVNLHVVSEPEYQSDGVHSIHGLHRALNLIPPLRGAVQLKGETRLEAAGDRRDLGLLGIETFTLSEVSEFLSNEVRAWREGVPPPRLPKPVDEPPWTCLPLILDLDS
jgi:hypothetical protein